MKRIIPFIILSFFYLPAFSQTTILGGVVSGTWTVAGSPYLIGGNLLIANGTSLTIAPGVTVNFQGNYKLLVSGQIIAAGNPADSIYFTAANSTTGWQGIRFENTLSTNDSSKISYCSIQNGNVGSGNNGGGIYVSQFSKLRIDHNSISNCIASAGVGGAIYMESSDALITDNKISFNHSIAGGIYILRGNPLIKNNTITYNDNILPTNGPFPGQNPDSFGGGLSVYETGATVTGNIITNNKSAAEGGGLVCYEGSPVVTGNTITNNQSKTEGGGVFGTGAITMTNNIISDNSTATTGGGFFYFEINGRLTLANNTIIRNTAAASGGGISINMNSSPASLAASISNNLIANNSVSAAIQNYDGGGGILISNCDTATIFVGNIIVNNQSPNGGGILCNNARPKLYNNTVANNGAVKGGGLYCFNSNPILLNMQLWSNAASSGGLQIYLYDDQSDPSITYSNVQGGMGAINVNGNFYLGIYQNNINADPLFTLPSAGNGTAFNGATAVWGLKNGSPSINAGKPGGAYPTTDYEANLRVVNNIIDIGAIETQPPPTLLIDKKEYSCDSSFNIAVRTKNVRNAVRLQGTVVWDTALIKFNGISFGTAAITFNQGNVNVSAVANGRLTFLWTNTARQSVSDSTSLFTIRFITNGTGKGKATVAFDSTPAKLEIETADKNGVSTESQGSVFTNGYIITPFFYYFTGSGDWTAPANWKDGIVPPAALPPCSEIFIDPSGTGECFLNIPQNIMTGAKITIMTGKKLLVKGDLILQ